MTRHIVSVSVSHGFDSEYLAGEGATEEEAAENCLAQVRQRLFHGVKLAEDIILPKEVAARVPTVPDGHGLLILECCSHSSGDSYDWRFFAVRRGTHALGRVETDWTWPFEAGAIPVLHMFADCNAEYEFTLPEGSMQFVDGGWVPQTVAQYFY